MAGTTPSTKETAALAVTGLGSWISLHTGDPGTTGANEATGGAPAYARIQTTWSGAGSDGVVVGSDVLIDVPAGTYNYVGIWSAASGGTFIGSNPTPLSPVITVSTQAQIIVSPTYTEA
jgi:hypothetical protein